ncbi:MAG: TonB-dependent receptor [Gammaproteobacteria bacterium]|nr:TonB-dependent receptor [Gammaproteobacteria bacterium]
MLPLVPTLLAALALPPTAAFAAPAEPGVVEEIIVIARTGSRIARQADHPSPIAKYDAETLRDLAARDLRDLVGTLTTSNGAENNSDNLTQNFTVGTANVNLRGLGVASTLVLLNGKRQVASAVQTDDGASFVDLAALVPVAAIDRVEVLRDGASAIYGTDAVAGVVNVITRQGEDGAGLDVEVRSRTGNGSQDDRNVDAWLGGRLGSDGSFLVAASWLDRSSLVLGEVDWLRPATSGFGNPGSFEVPSLGRTVADPGCTSGGGLMQELATGSTICRFDYGPQITAVPVEDRMQGYARADWDWSDATTLWMEAGFARNDISREVSPSFPVLNTPLVPASHPANIFGEDVLFQGRPYGVGQPTEINYYRHDTVRVAFGGQGSLSDRTFWDVSLVRSANDAVLNPRDIVAANFQAALRGYGGRDCDTAPTARTPARPGEGGCLYFNPFSSAFSARPGDPTYNDPHLREFIVGDYLGEGTSTLQTLDANVTGFFGNLKGGAAGYAVGVQQRERTLGFVYDTVTRHDGFAFLIGNPNFAGDTDVVAGYGELMVPFQPWLEVTGALRFEDYGEVGTTLDPKFTLLIAPSSSLSLRASAGTSFRAPSAFQTLGVQTNFVNITDVDGSTTFAGRRTVGDPDLRPENSQAMNFGITWQPSAFDGELGLDLWDYSFEDVLRKENAQAIVNADPYEARIERTSAGTISIVNVAFINADAIDTRGVDLFGQANVDWALGTLRPFFRATIMLAYDVTNAGMRTDGLGRLNRANVGAPNQVFKANAGLGFARGRFQGNLLLRHIGRYEDDRGADIDAFTTVDANVRVDLGEWFAEGLGTTVTLGAVNLAGTDPPFVNIAGSYDPRSADPRGRRVFLRLEARFGG